ncbi:MAG: DNA translocase FtsK [Aristaeellaceae bacterium]
MPAKKKQSKPKTPRHTPAYSADAMALHLVGGLLLIALGVLIFLSVVTGMSGDVFAGMRQVCYGMTGVLAFLLPIFPVWGGVLVLLSVYRKAPLRAFLLAVGLYVLLLAAVNLISTSGSPAVPLMRYFYTLNLNRGQNPSGFDTYLARSYELGCSRMAGGGALGMLLAWPLYFLLGNAVLGGVLCILGALVDFAFLIHLDVKGIQAKLRSRVDARTQRQQQEQAQLQQQELAWQQQMAERSYRPPVPEPPPSPLQDYPTPQAYAPAQERDFQPVQPDRRQAVVGFQPVMEGAYQPEQPRRVWHFSRQKIEPDDRQEARRSSRRDEGGTESPAPRPRRSWIFARKNDDEEETPMEPKRPPHPGHIFQRPEEPQPAPDASVPEQPMMDAPAQDAAMQPSFSPDEAPQAPMPSTPSAYQDDSLWQDDSFSSRRATWRSDEDAMPSMSRTRRPADGSAPRQTTGALRTAAPSQESATPPRQATGPIRPTAPGQRTGEPARKQQPLPSWSETPPWEEAPQPQQPAGTASPPRLQQEPPKDAWQPDLKLPPRKPGMEDEPEEAIQPPPYVYPGLELLNMPKPQAGISPEEDAMRSQRLEETLQSFKVPAKVRHVTHGPAISRFELELAAGIKVTKVTDLGKNIAMNMEVKSVRIEAPIPGKALVGVEVPNRKVETVTLREVLSSQPMAEAKSPLAVALGKDIAGTPIVCDLARMPHLLIAGATGSGKSVCINTMINSLLYRCSPQEVRLILVDPKVVELQCYNGIPHLLIPVVSDPHKAASALAWAVAEMMDRYKKFERKGVRAIDGYNARREDGEEFMPRIVIIIDELADLMMTCKREVEDHICRLAQLARAAGIHLVVATQRPSVDVITGLIKANIPSRIAFKVSSFIDSRTILDRQGAEQLLGWGDMLYLPTGEFTPIRVQGCFMSDDEVNSVTDFIRENSSAEYDPNILEQLEQMERDANPPSADTADATDNVNGDASLLAQCIEMAVNDGQVSTSLLQRRLKVGYARAGRLVDEMERRGIISAKDGAKPRMCLISREEFEAMQASGELDE